MLHCKMFHLSDAGIGALLVLNVLTVGAKLATTTANETLSQVHSSVAFNCRTTDPTQKIRWQFTQLSSDFTERIHNGLQLQGRFKEKFTERFDTDTRESVLTLTRAELNDTGTFACLETYEANYRVDFSLKVVAANSSVDAEIKDFAAPAVVPMTTSIATLRQAENQNEDSFKTTAIGGIVGVLVFCVLIVVILVFMVWKLRQTAAVANSVNETVRSGTMIQIARVHRRKRGHHSADAEPHHEDVSDSATEPIPTSSSQSSINHHYSEIIEPDTPVPATDVEVNVDDVSAQIAQSANAAQYQCLDPAAVIALSARQPSVYINLAHQRCLAVHQGNK